ncbi:MAG: urate hydroxylase PuuD, partial [Burkholderiaceae bacterium]|nr:urate hydroxylase PuuD [Burkholderiaceae bacterium]
YSFTYTGPYNWVVLVLMMTAGALIRQFFVMRHGFKLGRNANPLPYALAGVAVIAALVVAMRPQPEPTDMASTSTATSATTPVAVDFAEVRAVVTQRCVMCHGEAVQMKGIRLDSDARIVAQAQAIYQQAVVSRAMPMNNGTGMLPSERALLATWFKNGPTSR